MSARRRPLAVAGIAVAGVLAGLVVLAWLDWTRPRSPLAPLVAVRIPAGATVGAIADTLSAHGLLDHAATFVWGARLTGRDRELQAGRFALPKGQSPRRLLRLLVTGEASIPVIVTIPEGVTATTAAAAVADSFAWTADELLAACDDAVRALPPRTGADTSEHRAALARESAARGRPFPLCEGWLFPETYHFAEGVGAADVARTLVRSGWERWSARADSVLAAGNTPLRTPLEVLTLASIVQAEASATSEQRRVAAVYLNRLVRGRALEADPTVAYALGKQGERILFKDLRVDSAFNTYRNRGLPPGPIDCPGIGAITATLVPDPDCDALYFVADGKGGHVFSRTLSEHQAAVRAYRRHRGDAPPP